MSHEVEKKLSHCLISHDSAVACGRPSQTIFWAMREKDRDRNGMLSIEIEMSMMFTWLDPYPSISH